MFNCVDNIFLSAEIIRMKQQKGWWVVAEKKGKDPVVTGMVRIDPDVYGVLVKAAEIDKRNIRVCVMIAIEDWLKKNHPTLLN